jgi:hypothetical protein
MIDLASELKAVVSNEYKQAIDEILEDENITSNAERILQFCKIITKQINIVEY